jgi:catechol 2,3-dioxygenase-like lactoylglutathione lyase family enzyme
MAAQTAGTTRITGVGRVMIPVSDQDRAIDFYTSKLGFEKLADIPYGDGDRWVEVGLPGQATALALVRPRQGDPVGVDTHIALVSSDIDADHTDLSARGVDTDAEVARMGGPVPPMFWFRDQDGNTLMLVQTD